MLMEQRYQPFEGGIPMSTVVKNPVVKTGSSEMHDREASGVGDKFDRQLPSRPDKEVEI